MGEFMRRQGYDTRDEAMAEVDAGLLHQTEKAFLLDTGRTDGDGKPIGVWVSKSKAREVAPGTYEMPEWIAKKEGLI